MVMAPAGRVPGQRPADLPGRPARPPGAVLQPDARGLRGRRHRRAAEQACGDNATYTGTAGVRIVVVRAPLGLRAWRSSTTTCIGSGAINERLADAVGARRARTGCKKLAPFLSFDGDPYPVVLDGRVLLGDRRLHVDQSATPTPRAVGSDIQLSDETAACHATPTTCATASRRWSTPTTARCTFYVVDDERPDRAGVAVGVPRPVHAGERDARRAARAPALSGGPVPGADRAVLEVPARTRGLLRRATGRGRWPRRRPWWPGPAR